MRRSSRRPRGEISIVPLVDVLIVLIFFFLMTMQFRNLHTLNITPPDMETAGKNKSVEQLEIAVDADGKFYFNGAMVSQEELKQAVTLASSLNKDQPVLIIADEDSLLKHVTFIMDACRASGLDQLRLQSR